jgi:hypothetical protein
MSRNVQKLSAYVSQYILDKQRLPTKQEITQALSEPFQFSTRPTVPKPHATSDPEHLYTTLSGLLKDTEDILELATEFDNNLNQLRFEFRKENEELASRSTEVMDYLQSLSDAEEAVAMVYAGLPAEAGCSSNVVVSKNGISLEHNLHDIEDWTIEAAPISANSTVTRQRITDPGKLTENGQFYANIRSNEAIWTGVELFINFPPGEGFIGQNIRAITLTGTPSMMSFAYADEGEEDWTWNEPISFDGNLTYYVNLDTSALRIRFWNPGTEFAFTLKQLNFVSGNYVSKGTYYTLPILLKPGQFPHANAMPTGNYLLDIKQYLPEHTEMESSYALLTQAQLESYFYSDISGGDLNSGDLNYTAFAGNKVTLPVNLNPVTTTTPTASPFALPAQVLNVQLTSSTDAWLLKTDNSERRIWETHLVVEEAGQVLLGSYAEYFVIKRVTGAGQSVFSGAGQHALSPGVYRVICNVPSDVNGFSSPGEVGVNGLRIIDGDAIHREVLPLPFTKVKDQAIYNSYNTYSIDSNGIHFQYIPELTYTLKYRTPFASGEAPHVAVLLKSEMNTRDLGETPTIRRVRLMATDEVL